jgi:hypothetical protein
VDVQLSPHTRGAGVAQRQSVSALHDGFRQVPVVVSQVNPELQGLSVLQVLLQEAGVTRLHFVVSQVAPDAKQEVRTHFVLLQV